jgi:hypothetical protein
MTNDMHLKGKVTRNSFVSRIPGRFTALQKKTGRPGLADQNRPAAA